eukprot:403332002
MIAIETQRILDNKLEDFKLQNQQKKQNTIRLHLIDDQYANFETDLDMYDFASYASSDSSSSIQPSSSNSSCYSHYQINSKSISNSSLELACLKDQDFRGGKIILQNESNYSLFMQDLSKSRVFQDDSSICRFGSGKYLETYHHSNYNNSINNQERHKIPSQIAPQIQKRNISENRDTLVIGSQIFNEKHRINNQKSQFIRREFINIDMNKKSSPISESCVKLPYFQSQSGKLDCYNQQNSKKSTYASNQNSSIIKEDLMYLNDEELFMESVSSNDLEEELY